MNTRAPERPQGPSHVDERKLTGRTSAIRRADVEKRIQAHQMNGQGWVRMSCAAVCAHERLAIVAATETKVQICSGTTRQSCSDEKTKGAERPVKYHDSIRLCSISFRQLKGACARRRARTFVRTFERESERAERQTSGERKTRANKMSR